MNKCPGIFRSLFILFFAFISNWSYSQPFELWHYAENGYPKGQLKKDIQTAKNIDEAIRIVQTKVQNPTTEIVILYKGVDGIKSARIAKGKISYDDKISFVTKGNASTEISSIYELKHFIFYDTLIILDTCRLDVTILNKEEDLDRDGYYFKFTCTASDEEKKTVLPANDDNLLMIMENNLEKCNEGYYHVSFFNNASPEKVLASSYIFFPDSTIKKILLEDAIALFDSPMNLEDKDVAMVLTWSLKKYGHVNHRDMVAWLDRNHLTKTTSNGN